MTEAGRALCVRMRTFYAAASLLMFLAAASLFAAGVAFISRHWVLTVVFVAISGATTFLVGPVVVGWAKRRVSEEELAAAARRFENAAGAIGRAESGGWNPRRRDQQPPDS